MFRFGGNFERNEINPAMWSSEDEYNRALSSCMARVFMRMFLALMVSAIAAFVVAVNEDLLYFMFATNFFWVVMIVPFALVMVISAGINRMKASTATMLFFVYAAVNGMSLAFIMIIYEPLIIAQAFVLTALMFGGMAVFGYVTKKDLSRIGSMLIMALWGLLIASLINAIIPTFRSEPMSWLISYAMILVFVGLTAWDTQRIKHQLAGATSDEQVAKISTLGALRLYLNFLNIFLRVLKILSRR